MRWKKRPTPSIDDVRIVRRFLFLPLELESEVRWLEFAEVAQTYRGGDRGWHNDCFVDEFCDNAIINLCPNCGGDNIRVRFSESSKGFTATVYRCKSCFYDYGSTRRIK